VKVPYQALFDRYLERTSYVAVSKEFGVSDVTVKKAVAKIAREGGVEALKKLAMASRTRHLLGSRPAV
jgi:transposase